MSHKYTSIVRKSLHLVGVVLLCHALGTAARSIHRLKLEDKDPMMALPSSREQTTVQYVYQQVAPSYALAQTDPNQEMVVEYQPQMQVQAAPGAQQEQQYELVQIQGQQHQTRANEPASRHSHDGIDCNQRHELTTLMDPKEEPTNKGTAEQGTEYPGQLLYVGQNSNEESGLGNIARAWSQASDLSATILTEVPVRDMPQEVLKKLRRDYGVKVVATRERPGANLVINCDEYSSQESSICSKQLLSHEAAYRQQPLTSHEQVEAVIQAPRDQVQAYQHVAQPTSEPGHVYIQEVPAENQKGGEESRAAGEGEYSADGQGDEHSGQEGTISEPAAGAPSYESQDGEHEKSAPSQPTGGQTEEATGEPNAEAPQADHRAGAQPANTRESYELGASFEEQQSNAADGSSWPLNRSEGRDATTMRHSATTWAIESEESKQVVRAETSSAARQTTR